MLASANSVDRVPTLPAEPAVAAASSSSSSDLTASLIDRIVNGVVSRCAVVGVLLPLMSEATRLLLVKGALALDASARDDDVVRALHPSTSVSFEPVLRSVCDADEALRAQLADALLLSQYELGQTAAIVDELWLRGSRAFIASLSAEALRDVAVALALSADGAHEVLAERAFAHIFSLTRKLKRAKGEPAVKVKKPKFVPSSFEKIKHGITADELRSEWNLTDLLHWCQEQGLVLKSADKPKEKLIRFILSHLKKEAANAAASNAATNDS
jgi:hypothetical protein